MTTEILNKYQSTECPITDLVRWARDDWKKSGAGELFDANVTTHEGLAAIDKILISEKLSRTNTGKISAGYLAKYDPLYDGGWFLPVLNPLADFAVDDWGCFKPVKPRIKKNGGINQKPIKYEHPPGMSVQPFFLRVTYGVWERIAQRHNVAMPELPEFLPGQGFDRSKITYGKEFWEWVIANTLPVTITEGGKKTASLLCAGYVAIGLPGVWNFSEQKPKPIQDADEIIASAKSEESWKRPLNPWLQSFFSRFETLNITIAFDSDTRTTTAQEVYKAACRLAAKITWQIDKKAVVKIAQWHPELGKGIDDVLVQNGIETVKEILDSALPVQVSKFRNSLKLTYPTLELNRRYLGTLPTLSSKIVAVKSPKNTGKTHSLAEMTDDAYKADKKVISLGHRVQLQAHLCSRFGLEFLNQIDSSEQWLMVSCIGFGLVIDSLHPGSKAKFDLTDNEAFDGCILVIDECEQVLKHLLTSNTLKSNRAEIVHQLKILCQVASKIYLSDADLSDFSIDFFRKIAELGKENVAVIENLWKFEGDAAWNTYIYQENSPDRLMLEAEKLLQQGKRVFLLCGSQQEKSLFSAQNIATRLSSYCQGKVLVIDGDTVADPNHDAYGISGNLNKLGEYQLVACTSVLETGVSIESDYFDAVFYQGHGVQSVESVAQFLGRYRPSVDRHIWVPVCCAKFMKFDGALSSKQINYYLTNNKKRHKKIVKDFPDGLSNALLDAYCESIAHYNLGLSCYRENLAYLLEIDGHRCHYVDAVKTKDTEIREIRDAAYNAEVDAIQSASNPSDTELDTLNNSVSLTKTQRYKKRKGNLIRQYGDCDKALIKADDDGCFRPLQLLYFLTVGKDFAASYDAKQIKTFTSKTQCLDHEITKYAVSVRLAYLGALFDLGLSRLLTGEKFSKDDPFLTDVIAKLNPDEFVETFGRGLPVKTGDRINTILDLIGYQKKYDSRVGTGRNAIRHYVAFPKFEDVDVDQIFAYWFDRDMKSLEISGTGNDSEAGEISGTGNDSEAGEISGDDLTLAYTDDDILEIISEMCQAPDKETLDLLAEAYFQGNDRLKQRAWSMMTQEQKIKVRQAKNNIAGDFAGAGDFTA
jgi:hypothetical protein